MAAAAHDPSSVSQLALRRQAPAVGAACGKAARADLREGRQATDVPTATQYQRQQLFSLCKEYSETEASPGKIFNGLGASPIRKGAIAGGPAIPASKRSPGRIICVARRLLESRLPLTKKKAYKGAVD